MFELEKARHYSQILPSLSRWGNKCGAYVPTPNR